MEKRELALERKHFDEVEAVIQENLNMMYEKRAQLKNQVVEARQDMWDNGRHVVRDFDDAVLLASQDSEVDAAESRYEQNELEIRRQTKLRLSPFFGRLDYEECGQGASRTVYIGMFSLRSEGSHRMLVVDWRAPVASMFYSFDLGAGWYEVSNARRNVNITLKRQYKIENGKFLLMYDTDSAMYDEILGSVLSQNTDRRLKVIIGSIQKEQNAAIRSDTGRSCLIYGLAGSGKTSVGLHRLAYILYRSRDAIRAENILIISNNSIFGSYISTILPDLGEKAAESKVFRDLLQEAVGERLAVEDYYAQLREIEARPNSERAKLIKLKYSSEFLDYCAERFAAFPYKIPKVSYQGTVIVSQRLFQKRWSRMRFSSFQTGYELMRKLICEMIDEFFRENRERVFQDIENGSEEHLLDQEVRALYRRMKRRYTAIALEEIDRLNRLSPEKQTVDLLADFLERSGEDSYGAVELFQSFQRKKLLYEDALLYLFVRILMGETPPRTGVRHIVLDEAQDYCPLQLAILKRLYPKSDFTILADVYQTINSVTTVQEYGLFDRAFGPDLMKIRLGKCYRSSSEINALAFQLIGYENPNVQREYSYFERPVKKPRYLVCPDPLPRIKSILKRWEHYNSIAVITGSEEQAAAVKESLPGEEAQLIVSPDDQLDGKLVILPLPLAKGLEFDAVILLNAISANRGAPDFRRKAYLGCTRALHELYLLESQELPAEMEDCLPYLERDE